MGARKPDYARLVARAQAVGWTAAVEEALGPGEAYRLKTDDHRAAASMLALPATGGTALDMACGLGSHAVALASVCKHVVATDDDPDAVRLLEYRAREDGIDNLLAQTEDPVGTLAAESVQLAVTRGRNIDRLSRVVDLLSPGGRLVLGAPNSFSFVHRAAHEKRVSLRVLKKAGTSANLQLIEIYGAWRDADDVSLLFTLSPESLRSAARRIGLPAVPTFLSPAWVPAYWVVWEKPL